MPGVRIKTSIDGEVGLFFYEEANGEPVFRCAFGPDEAEEIGRLLTEAAIRARQVCNQNLDNLMNEIKNG